MMTIVPEAADSPAPVPADPAPVLAETGPAAPSSLRERKKLATRRSLRRTALRLIAERGFAHVTVEDIAAAAEVSPRTFFNYFPSKEAVLFGADPDRTAGLHDRLLNGLPGQPPLDILHRVLCEEARAVTAELDALGEEPADWVRRIKAARNDPHLRAAQAAHMALVEHAITGALAERLGADPDRDPYPQLLAGAALGTMRAVMSFWTTAGGTVPLSELLDSAMQALADGLPENCAVRGVASVPGETHRKDHHS